MPDLDFDADDRRAVREALKKDHHPSAAQENLAREKRALSDARDRRAALAR